MKLNQIIRPSRSFTALLLILLFILNSIGQIRDIEISRFFQPASPRAIRSFLTHGRFAGGVVPQGTAEFITSPNSKVKLNASRLELVIDQKNKEKLLNRRSDYDVFGIKLKGNKKVYRFAAQDDLVYPLMKFIQREGSYIAYTISQRLNFNQEFYKDYFDNNGLVKVNRYANAFIAKEFNYDPHIVFLNDVDHSAIDTIDDLKLKTKIMSETNRFTGKFAILNSEINTNSRGSRIHADYNVKYQALLDGSKNLVDVGGIPFIYDWETKNGTINITDVRIFKFPETKFDTQYRAILFFQAAAILRQFKKDNPREFNRFLVELGKIVGNG